MKTRKSSTSLCLLIYCICFLLLAGCNQSKAEEIPSEGRIIKRRLKKFSNWVGRKAGITPPQTLRGLELDLANEKIKLEKSKKESFELREKLRIHLEKANQRKLDLEREILEKERTIDFHQNKVDFYEGQILDLTN